MYNVIVIGISIIFFILVFYMENWLINSLVSIIIFGILFWRQSSFLLINDTTASLSFRAIFVIIIYSGIAYRIDQKNKLAFLS